MKLFTKKYLSLFVMLISIIAIMTTTIGCDAKADDDNPATHYFFGDNATITSTWSALDFKNNNMTGATVATTDGANGTAKYLKYTATDGTRTTWNKNPDAIDTSKYTKLVFWAKAASKVSIELGGQDKAGKEASLKADVDSTDWKMYEVLLSTITTEGFDRTTVSVPTFLITTPNVEVSLDEIYLTE